MVKKRYPIKCIIRNLRKDHYLTEDQLKKQIMSGTYEIDSRDFEYAKDVLTAEEFVRDFIKDNGTKAFISERLRDGYIGKEINENGKVSIQAERGKPFGTVVAIPTSDPDNPIALGFSYMSPYERFRRISYPVLGQAIALKRAIAARDGQPVRTDIDVRPKSKDQTEHFTKRALAYFYPDIYSYSRGQEGKKVVYDDWEEIHERIKIVEKMKHKK